VKGAVNVANAATRAGVKHLVLISSVSVYGPHGTTVCAEETACQPLGPYAESKYQAENQTKEIVKQSRTQLTVLRLATVYGEGDPGNVARLMRMIDRGRFVWVGDGSNRKSLIHKDDVGLACLEVLRQPHRGINTYNVSTNVSTMREIVEGLAAELGRGLPRWRIPSGLAKTMANSFDRISRRKRTGRFGRTVDKWLVDDVYDGSKFNRQFDFAASVSLQEGLRREVAWYREPGSAGILPAVHAKRSVQ
jgi:nucleoside-diphosphate-sugar epimerase